MNTFIEGDRVQMNFVPNFVGTVVNIDVVAVAENDMQHTWIAVQWDGQDIFSFYPADKLILITAKP